MLNIFLKKVSILLLAILPGSWVLAQTGANCNDALPFCTGTNYTFPNSTGIPSLGNVACLGSTPNPIWYYFQVQTTGNIDIFMSQTNAGGGGLDVDFAVWGPFPSLAAGCGNPFPAGTPVDCSYSAAPTETANIPNAPAGQYYIMLITNFSNQSGTITFSQSGGSGTTNCGLLAGGSSNGPICEGQTLALTATQVPGASYSWTGPNGFASVQQNPIIPNTTVANSGVYTLIVTSPTAADTAFIDGIVNPKPVAAFSADPVLCLGQPASFSAAGSTPAASISTYQWIFNNSGVVNQTTTVPNTQFTYPVAGVYNTAVIVTANGCRDTANQQVTVYPNPVANLTVQTEACENQLVTLDASGSTVGGGAVIVEYRWDINDDGVVDNVTQTGIVNQAFPAGNYSIRVTVLTAEGCSASTARNLVVYEFPEIDFDYNNACVGGITAFTNSTQPANSAYNWDFGHAGITSTQASPSIIYPGVGSYDVALIATVNNLCSDTLVKTVTISNDVTASFAFNEPCGLTGVFTDESSIPAGANGNINTWNWSFGDGNTSTAQNPVHVYVSNNTNAVTLIVGTAEGCFDTLTQQVPKYAVPVADFSVTSVCLNAPSLYTDNSSVSSGDIVSWNWDLGNNTTSANPLPALTYANPGNYTANLIITTEFGCSDTASYTFDVFPNPIADFVTSPPANTTLLEPEVQFIDLSTGANQWLWTVGTVGSTNEQNVLWTFETTGTYIISLEVTNEFGCTDLAKQEFIVTPAYNFFAPNAFTPFDGDQLNPYWTVSTMGMKEMQLSIFNRWGELLYSTQDPYFLWDGKYDGKELPSDVYVFKANTRDIAGKQYQYIGTITLVR